MKAFIVTLLLLSFSSFANQLFQIKQADGSILYTDQPLPGATPVELQQINSVQMAKAKTKPALTPPPERKQTQTDYQVQITSPGEKQAIRNNAGNLSIQSTVSPSFNGQYALYMDNQQIKTQANSRFSLENVDRGEHKIQIKLLDKSGKVIASSSVRTFYLMRASALIRPN